VKIPFHYSLRRALAVLELIDLPKVLKDEVWAEAFDNGREQGLAIHVQGRGTAIPTILFLAQNRNSDATVVYLDRDILGTRNMPSDEAWRVATYFPDGEERKAAAYILATIHSLISTGGSK